MNKTLAQTPHSSFQGSERMSCQPLPGGQPFLAGHIDLGNGFAWDPGGVDLDARPSSQKRLAMDVMSSKRERTSPTFPLEPRTKPLSFPFLTSLDMRKTDPVSNVERTFHDLLDRQQKLDATANMSCLTATDFPLEELFHEFVPPAFVH